MTALDADVKDVHVTGPGLELIGCVQGKDAGQAVASATYSPPLAGGFPLGNRESRSFIYKVRGHCKGFADANIEFSGETAAGTTAHAAGSESVEVAELSGPERTSAVYVNPPSDTVPWGHLPWSRPPERAALPTSGSALVLPASLSGRAVRR